MTIMSIYVWRPQNMSRIKLVFSVIFFDSKSVALTVTHIEENNSYSNFKKSVFLHSKNIQLSFSDMM